MVIYDEGVNLVCKILDEEIRNEYVDPTDITLGTFNDYDMKNLVLLNVNRPIRRLVRFRAICNRATAISYGFINDADFTQLLVRDVWSPTGLENNAAMEIWFKCLPSDSNYTVVPENNY